MNNLQVTAKAALSVLHRVQLGLERIVNDTGSAELLPTIRDQIKDALKIIDMEIEGAILLAASRQAQAEAQQARIDLEASMRSRRLESLADKLADEFGPAPLSRPDLLQWLGDQVERVKATGQRGANATAMVDGAYLELQAQHG